jgi:hypothetical protein
MTEVPRGVKAVVVLDGLTALLYFFFALEVIAFGISVPLSLSPLAPMGTIGGVVGVGVSLPLMIVGAIYAYAGYGLHEMEKFGLWINIAMNALSMTVVGAGILIYSAALQIPLVGYLLPKVGWIPYGIFIIDIAVIIYLFALDLAGEFN